MRPEKTHKIKICHITTAHDPFDDRVFHKECKSLAANGGFEVYLIARHDSGETIDGVRLLGIARGRRNCKSHR